MLRHRRKHSRAYGVIWDESTTTPACVRVGQGASANVSSALPANLAIIQSLMKRCVINDAGVVQYYLDPSDSTLKENGDPANLDGSDGQVMVEIPLGWLKYSYANNQHTHIISKEQFNGAERLDAFYKNSAWVSNRYIGAYAGILYNTSELKFVNGLYLPSDASYKNTFTNVDDKIVADTLTHPFSNLEVGVDKIVVSGTTHNDGTYDIVTKGDNYITIGAGGTLTDEANIACLIQVQRDWTASSGDVLGSVSGKAPMNQGTRAEFRAAADNRGTGWRQWDFDLVSVIQLLYLAEYADWNSQSMIGNGLTDWTGAAWLAWSNYNPIEKAGISNGDGNATANVSGGDATVGSYMTYRGIENFFGHLWKWVDGININGNVPYVCNTDTDFADDTVTNYTALGVTLADADGYVVTLEQIGRGFLAASVGGTSSTYITDYYYQSTGWRVAKLGTYAYDALAAGVAYWHLGDASGHRYRYIAGRLAF